MGYVQTGQDLPAVCPHCRYPTRSQFNYCPSCGEGLRDVCEQCQTPLEAGWHFCPECGSEREGAPSLVGPPSGAAPDMAGRAEEHNTRGSELYENNEYDEAIREFSAAVTLMPDNPLYRTNLAVVLSETGDYDRAIAEFKESIRLDPQSPASWLQLADTYQDMERPLQAEGAYRKVIELAPDSPEADDARAALEGA